MKSGSWIVIWALAALFHVGGSYAGVPHGQGYSSRAGYGAVENLFCQGQCTPTVYPVNLFDAEADANVLKAALKDFTPDTQAIINVISRRSINQRLDIVQKFKSMWGKDLISIFESKLHGNFKKTVIALMTRLPEYYAQELHRATSGIGTDKDTIIEVLTSLSNDGVNLVSATYKKLYGNTLENDLKSETSGYFKRILVSLSHGHRNTDNIVNVAEAKMDARRLHEAGEGQWGTEKSTFNAILMSKSYPQLRRIFDEYERIAGDSLEKSIKLEFTGSVQKGYLAVVKCARDKATYFAEKLHKAMAGFGTTDSTLIRIIVARSELDLGNIKEAYNQKYGKTLAADVKDDTSGDYEKLLLALIGH